jgi:hypothetical protein
LGAYVLCREPALCEIGIRMSLGATRGRIVGEVLPEGTYLALVGLAAGIAGAFAAGRIPTSFLREAKRGDPLIFVATGGLLAAVALIACYILARRAARFDPDDRIAVRMSRGVLTLVSAHRTHSFF